LLARSRALRKLKTDERCPGETVCTTDKQVGRIAAGLGRTLENYCKAERCPLYYSKPSSLPAEFEGALEVIVELHTRKKVGGTRYLPRFNEIPYWALEVLKVAERVRSEVAADEDDEAADVGGAAGAQALEELKQFRARMQQKK
jgi:hypothetical protein